MAVSPPATIDGGGRSEALPVPLPYCTAFSLTFHLCLCRSQGGRGSCYGLSLTFHHRITS